jgi:hypothetical protein
MEKLLIEIHLFVCRVYDTSPETCYQRLSNNRAPDFTDQEIVAILVLCPPGGMFREEGGCTA